MTPFKPFDVAKLPQRTDAELMAMLVKVADYEYDGHLTILKFTTNWRIGFGTPNDREDIDGLNVGKTFREAAQIALFPR
jgi:hypothetical protein